MSKQSPAAQNRYILHNGKLQRLSLYSKVIRECISGIIAEPFRRRGHATDESIHDFIQRRFGKPLATKVVSAVIHGIYATDSSLLSTRATALNALWKLEEQYGSVIIGMLRGGVKETQTELIAQLSAGISPSLRQKLQNASLYSFQGGLTALVDRLRDAMTSAGVTIKSNVSVDHITLQSDGIQLFLSTGESTHPSHVIATQPTTSLAQATTGRVSTLLSQIHYASVCLVNITLPDGCASPTPGFGFLVPAIEHTTNPGLLGVVFDSDVFGVDFMQGHKLTAIFGGGLQDPSTWPTDEEYYFKRVRQEVLPLCRGNPSDAVMSFTYQQNCIPQYRVGHVELVKDIQQAVAQDYNNRLFLAGAAYHGVGVNDCILDAYKAVKQIV